MKIAIASGKGGTGKTFVSTNLFRLGLAQGRNILLADCDAEAPNVTEFFNPKESASVLVKLPVPEIDTEKCVFCGKCYEYCEYNAIFYLPNQKRVKVLPDLCHSCGACVYVCKHDAIQNQSKGIGSISFSGWGSQGRILECRTKIGVHSPVPIIKSVCKHTQQGITLMDSPPGISCPFVATVQQADLVLLVTEPTPFGFHDLNLSIDTLSQMQKPYAIILNRVGLSENNYKEKIIQKGENIILEIPFDLEIAKAYSSGKIIVENSLTYQNLFENLWAKLDLLMESN